jgi:hypothetical protein
MLLNVHCRIASGLSPEVWLTNLSQTGCQLILRAGILHLSQRIVITPQDNTKQLTRRSSDTKIAPPPPQRLPGTVRWVFEDRAGIQFDEPLDKETVDRLLAAKPISAIPPERVRNEFVDQFGRPLPEWPRARNSGSNRGTG